MGLNSIFDAHSWAVVPFHFWSLCFFVFGCIVGSFLNVCIHRLPHGLSIVSPPSHCPHCKYSIPFYLNIPLVTWLWLGGRCRNCGAPIAVRYFLVELLTGLAFLGSWLKFGDPADPLPSIPIALVYAVFLAGLIVATFTDVEHLMIPDEITFGGILAGFVVCFFWPQLQGASTRELGLAQSFLGAFAGAGTLYAIVRLGKLFFGRQKLKLDPGSKIVFSETAVFLEGKEVPYDEIFYRKSDRIILHARTLELVDRSYKDVWVRLSPSSLQIGEEQLDPDDVACMECVSAEVVLPREAMGLGDVKFLGAIGAFIGWKAVFFTLTIGTFIGSIYGMTMIALKRQTWSGRLYFGPFLAFAAALWVFEGRELIAWYQNLMQRLMSSWYQ